MANTFNHNDKVVITDGGSVGIGTTSPAQLLHIKGTNPILNVETTWATGNYGQIRLGYTGGTNRSITGHYDNGMTFDVNGERMRIDTAGNVGIGTTSPGYKLDVSAAARALGVRIGRDFSISNRATVRLDSYGDNPADILFGQDTSASQTSWNGVYWSISSRNSGSGAAAGNKFTIFRGNAHASPNNSEVQFLTITPDLKVGIGTTSPSQKLHIYGGNISIDNSSDVALIFAKSGASKYEWYLDNTANNFGLYDRGNSSWRFNVTNSGNVGIGTTSPVSKLQVEGDIALSNNGVIGQGSIYGNVGNSSFTTLKLYDSATGSTVLNNQSYDIQLATAGSTKIIVSNNGNVGIGTTSPGAKFHLQGSNLMATFRNSSTGANQYTQLEFIAGSRSAYIWLGNQNSTSWAGDGGLNIYTTTGNMDFWTAASQRMRITSGGNVGIGTTSPSKKLHVLGQTRFDSYSLSDPDTTSIGNYPAAHTFTYYSEANGMFIVGGQGSYTGTTLTIGQETNASSSFNHFRVIADTNGTPATQFVIRGDGNVGIGTGSPSQTLTVEDTIGIKRADVNAVATIQQTGAGTEINAPSGYHPLIIKHNGTEFARFKNDGNVGIGTSSPSYRLSVSGADNNIVASFDHNSFVSRQVGLPGRFMVGPLGNGYPEIGYNFTTASSTYTKIVNDTAWSINFGNNSRMSFKYAGAGTGEFSFTEHMVINTSGNVGIGTTSPSSILQVGAGSFSATNSSYTSIDAGAAGILFRNAYDAYLTFNTTYSASGWVNKYSSYKSGVVSVVDGNFQVDLGTGTTAGAGSSLSNKFTILNNGNVGIGTTSPSEKLDINGRLRLSYNNYGWIYAYDVNHSIIMRANRSGTENNYTNYYQYGGTLANGLGHLFWTGGTLDNQTLRMQIADDGTYFSGNVGIGTTSPATLLDVPGKVRLGPNTSQSLHAALQVSAGEGTNSLYRDIDIHGSWATGEAHAITATYGAAANLTVGQMVFQFTNPGSQIKWGGFYHSGPQTTYPMMLVSDGSNGNLILTGKVGIGLTSPSYSIDISGGAIAIRGNAPGNSLRFDDSAGTSRNAMYVDTSNYLNIGNSNYSGLKLIHSTTTGPNTNGFGGQDVQQAIGTVDDGTVLAAPAAWLEVRVGTTDYVIPMYTTG